MDQAMHDLVPGALEGAQLQPGVLAHRAGEVSGESLGLHAELTRKSNVSAAQRSHV